MDWSKRIVVRMLLTGMWTLSLFTLVYPARAQAQGGEGAIHRVVAGETLSQIARQYDTDVATLLELNGLVNANVVYVGQQLIVAGGGWAQPNREQPRWQDEESSADGPAEPSYNRQGVGWEPQQSRQAYQRAGVAWEPQRNDRNAYREGAERESRQESQWQPQPRAGSGRAVDASGEKWIDIDIGDQMLTAYQGDTAVRFFIISSGSSYYPTVTGSFRTYSRTEMQDMSGGSKSAGDYYFQADVPWVQYFFEGYAIHGAYRHNRFGTPVGHGCINMRVDESQWLYEWAGVTGIRVEVHN